MSGGFGDMLSGGFRDKHKPTAEYLGVGVPPTEQEGCLSAASGCRREVSNCCLCLCIKHQFRLPNLSGVVSWKGCHLRLPSFYWLTSMLCDQ